jgi:hypothetical protein
VSEFGLILELILKLLPMIKPSELEKIKGEIGKLEEERAKEKQTALAAVRGDVAAINIIAARILDDIGM